MMKAFQRCCSKRTSSQTNSSWIGARGSEISPAYSSPATSYGRSCCQSRDARSGWLLGGGGNTHQLLLFRSTHSSFSVSVVADAGFDDGDHKLSPTSTRPPPLNGRSCRQSSDARSAKLGGGHGRAHQLLLLRSTHSSSASATAGSSFDDGGTSSTTDSSLIQEYATLPQTPISLQMLMKTGQGELLGKSYREDAIVYLGSLQEKHHVATTTATQRILIQMASLLRHEIPIRLAHRIYDLEHVPLMRDMPSVQMVRDIYKHSFYELVNVPPIVTPDHEVAFANQLYHLYNNQHAGILVQMAKGAYELREAMRKGQVRQDDLRLLDPSITTYDFYTPSSSSQQQAQSEFSHLSHCHAFLDRFYMSRIGIRVLVGQYLALRQSSHPNYIGMICLQTSPRQIVKHASDLARQMCRQQYNGRAPLVQISGRLDLTFPYVPTYLQYVMLELLKNSLRATCEYHGAHHKIGAVKLPPIQVIIADGHDNEDVVIKVSDEGGGIARSQIHKIWSYLYTTADPSIQHGFIGSSKDTTGTQSVQQDHSTASPIAGLGYGLPISRSYCRYFGGQMDLVSMEGYGTDAFVHLKRVGDANEPLEV